MQVPQAQPAELLQQKINRVWGGYNQPELVLNILGFLSSNSSSVDNVRVTDSSGGVLTFIIENVSVVIQHYRSAQVFQNLVKRFKRLKKAAAQSQQLAGCVAAVMHIDEKHLNIYVDKVMPLNSMFPKQGDEQIPAELKRFVQKNAKKILHDCSKSIDLLRQANLAQRDVSVDNIGIKNGNFVLFDYNLLSEGSRQTERIDNKSLVQSLIAHGCRNVLPDDQIQSFDDLMSEWEDDYRGLQIDFTL